MNQRLRREDDRSDRERRIVAAARELAETEGWEAATTRRLAALIEYSQPVLYSHFAGKDAIMAAAALQAFAEFAESLGRVREGGVHAVAEAYVAFTEEKPALYDAMFALATDLPFAAGDTPAVLRDAFAALLTVIEPVTGDQHPGTLTEVFWGALHGLVVLDRGHRLSVGERDGRLAVLVSHFGG